VRKVAGIGESILDVIFRDGQPQKAVVGGSVLNCMISLSRSGIPAIFISELGNDRVGRLMKNFMQENRLNTDYIYVFDEGASPVSLAFLDKDGNAEYQFFTDYPEKRLQTKFPVLERDSVLVLGSYFAVNPKLRPRVRELLLQARENKAIIYYDINFRKAHAAEAEALAPVFAENFEFADIVRCSDEDLAIIEKYLKPNCKNFILTCGKNPISLWTPHITKEYAVEPVEPVSTIGAGDNFNAGIVYGIFRENIGREALDNLPEPLWDKLIEYGKRFATAVCLSEENYISY
jgi:fructokinase